MELKFVIPNMEKTFGNLEFAGEDKVIQRRINGQLGLSYGCIYAPASFYSYYCPVSCKNYLRDKLTRRLKQRRYRSSV